MANLILYHGSFQVVKKPIYGKGNPHNDYGLGFYCTEHSELAKEWACSGLSDGFVNQYEIDISQLNILDLSSEKYTILHWLALLMDNRIVSLSSPVMMAGADWLKEHFLPDIRPYDAIIGYRADDSYFSFARAFVNNEISVAQLNEAMMLGDLGEQFVLKSEKAFDLLRFISFETAARSIYFPRRRERDEAARMAYSAEIKRDILEGLYIRDLIREEVSADDPRIQ
ncbi:MAG: DUF3990 domain-containing protein [Lachnospiraceae bacterium]|nr:DUF3990 domain-containing protein [Lachnospiraceae bacterium]